jgi:ankyrin repeat protein
VYGWTALDFAVFKGHYECCAILIDCGAKLNSVDNNKISILHRVSRHPVYLHDITCTSPLTCHIQAVALGVVDEQLSVKMISLLVKHGVDVHAVDEIGSTPLLDAAFYGLLSCLKLLQQNVCITSTMSS